MNKTKEASAERSSANVRLAPQTHKELAVRAALRGMSMGDYIEWLMAQVPVEDAELRDVFRRGKR